MPFLEKVIWTVCPQAKNGDSYDVNLFLTPRLVLQGAKATPDTGHTLKEVPHWLDWPALVNQGKIGIAIVTTGADGKETVDAIEPDKITWRSKPRSDVYTALFTQDTPLNDYEFKDVSQATLLSYPVARLAQSLGQLYGHLGASHATELPLSTDLKALGWPFYSINKSNEDYHPQGKDLLGHIKTQGLDATLKTADLHTLLNMVGLFHSPLAKETDHTQPADAKAGRAAVTYPSYKKVDLPSEDYLRRQFDFHRRAAAIGNHHALARLCGLVLELSLPAARVPSGEFRLAAIVRRPTDTASGKPGLAPIDLVPRTVCVNDAKGFRARAHTESRFDQRQLAVAATAAPITVALVQLDVDGAAHKAVQMGHTLDTIARIDHDDDSFIPQSGAPDAPAPSLRSAGLMLVQSGRHQEVSDKAAVAAKRDGVAAAATADNAKTPGSGIADIYAEDLVRGYRADIADVTPTPQTPTSGAVQWRSLCSRIVTYDLLTAQAMALPDLGPLTKPGQPGLIAPDNPPPNVKRFALPEEGTLSLALGSTADTSSDADPDLKGVYTLHEGLFVWRGWSLSAPEPVKMLRTDFPAGSTDDQVASAPQSAGLAKMPFVANYTVQPGTLPRLRFGRTYRARLRVVDLTGESAAHDVSSTPATITAASTYKRYEPVEGPVVTLVRKSPVKPTDLIPQKGLLATVDQPPAWGESMRRVVLRTSNGATGNLNLPVNPGAVRRNLAPPRVTLRFAETHGVLDTSAGALDKTRFQLVRDQDHGFANVDIPQADPPLPGQTAVSTSYAISDPKFSLPYLPDPMCIGLHVRMKRIGDRSYDTYADAYLYRSSDWPHPAPVMIEGSESYTKLEFDDLNRVFRVPMPKGCRQRLRISAIMPVDAQGLDTRSWDMMMALWDDILKTSPSSQDRQDLIQKIRAGNHWMFTPWREMEFVHAVQKPLIKPQILSPLTPQRASGALDAILNFTTPVSGISTARLDLKANWSEPNDIPEDAAAKSAPMAHAVSEIFHQRPIARIDGHGGAPYSFANLAHPFHDTRYRRVTYQIDAMSRFRECFDASIRDSDDGIAMKVSSDPVRAWVLNSAPPPAPKVLYVIPTFGWLGNVNKAFTASKRTAGLRVYLDRPWMTTGYNEMLAVILPNTSHDFPNPHDASGDDAYNRPFITQWGRDPLMASAPVTTNSPAAEAFTQASWAGPITYPGTAFDKTEGSDLPPGPFKVQALPVPGQSTGANPQLFDIVPHQVGFDPDRQLWYADVALDLPDQVYYPFLRLAVARYQPMSVDGVHLSAPVTCDFMRISPDRVAVLLPGTDKGGTTQVFELFIFGMSPPDAPSIAAISLPVKSGLVDLSGQLYDDSLDPFLGWSDDSSFKISASSGIMSYGGDANVLAAASDIAKLMKLAPVNGQTVKQASAWTTPELMYWARFTTGANPANQRRRLLITESESYAHDDDDQHGSRIIYAAELPL